MSQGYSRDIMIFPPEQRRRSFNMSRAQLRFFEIENGSWSCLERRGVTPLSCDDKHTEEGLQLTIEALKDCTAVIAAKIGSPVRRALEKNGISVFERTDTIDNALSKLAAYYSK
jgi:uroporphyrinogen-III synthase